MSGPVPYGHRTLASIILAKPQAFSNNHPSVAIPALAKRPTIHKHCTGDERKNLPEKCPDILQCRGEVGWYGQYPGKHQIDTRIIKCHGCLRRRYSVSIGIKRMQKNPLCFQEFYFLSLAELLCAFCVMHDCVCAQLLQSLFAGMLSFVVETGRARFRESVRLSGCTSGLSVLRLCRTQNDPNIADVGALPPVLSTGIPKNAGR